MKNYMKKAMVLSEKDTIDVVIEDDAWSEKRLLSSDLFSETKMDEQGPGFNQTIATVEKQILSNALEKNRTTRSLASSLKMSQSQVVRKLTKHGLNHLLKRNSRHHRDRISGQ